MIVRVINKICNAISFGVFLRLAPSTMEIILSRKLFPASAVTLIISQSLVTVVPPVTALLSPPDSRMTGADSPVIALSSTLATPTMTSPSMGICSPAFTRTMSPGFNSLLFTSEYSDSGSAVFNLRAMTSLRAFFRLSACARPLPSAIASAKFPNKEVNQRISEIANMYQLPPSLIPPSERKNRIVVKIAPR